MSWEAPLQHTPLEFGNICWQTKTSAAMHAKALHWFIKGNNDAACLRERGARLLYKAGMFLCIL